MYRGGQFYWWRKPEVHGAYHRHSSVLLVEETGVHGGYHRHSSVLLVEETGSTRRISSTLVNFIGGGNRKYTEDIIDTDKLYPIMLY